MVDSLEENLSYSRMCTIENRIMDFFDAEGVHPESAKDHCHLALNRARLGPRRFAANLNDRSFDLIHMNSSSNRMVTRNAKTDGQLNLAGNSLLARRRNLAP